MERDEIIKGLYQIKNWKCNGDAEMHEVIESAIKFLEQTNTTSDTISRMVVIDAVHKNYDTILDFKSNGRTVADSFEDIINALPSAEPEEAIPVSWIEAIIKKFMMAGDALSGLTASIIRVMLNEWKREQERRTE